MGVKFGRNTRLTLRKTWRNLNLRLGSTSQASTSPDQVFDLVSRLRPVATEQGLVRIGPDTDGGYLLPDDLNGLVGCFSPGVANCSDFELEIAEKYDIPVFLADHSVDRPATAHGNFSFTRKFLGIMNDDVYIRLDDWVTQNAPAEGDLLLQMDIEGAEFPVLADTSEEVLRRFRIMVIEFHDLDLLFNSAAFPLLNHYFSRLLQFFDIVHWHPNNVAPTMSDGRSEVPYLMEATFLRKDRTRPSNAILEFPHALDHRNVRYRGSQVLPECFWPENAVLSDNRLG